MNFPQATAVQQLSSHTYRADLQENWCIGTVPHGGYVTSILQQVVRTHFDTTLKKQDQPHTLALHLDFLRRTQTGPATFTVKDVKLGRQMSIVHVTLTQDDREEIVGYITNTNLRKESGVSFPTQWSLHPKPLPVADFAAMEAGRDPNWGERKTWPFSEFRKAASHIRSWFPRAGQHSNSCLDMWYTFSDPSVRFTTESLGFVIDTFPQTIEAFVLGFDPYSVVVEEKYSDDEQRRMMKEGARMWYPTLLLNLDVKKALPEDGVKWLGVRLEVKKIENGRYDLEVLAFDEGGDLVAISNHVCLVVDSERNLAARRKVDKGDSKL